MKRLFLILLLLAAPAFAQSGDCTAETGTSTTWAIQFGDCDQGGFTVLYTFYAAGLRNELTNERDVNCGPGDSETALADLFCTSVDTSREADEWNTAFELVDFFGSGPANPESVQPAYPEVCGTVYPSPSTSGGTGADNCRKAEFHQWLMRLVWPEDALIVFRQLYGIWDWLQSPAQQDGAAFNTNEVQTWLGDPADWAQSINPRMNNLDAISTGLTNDAQWQGDLQESAP